MIVHIEGYEGLYGIDKDGNVWSYTTKKFRKIVKGKRGKGYMQVGLWKDNLGTNHYIHQLVAKAYLKNPDNKLTVNHLDGDVENNHVNNLEWATHQEQIDHAWNSGLTNNHGERCGTSKLSNKQATQLILDYKTGGMSQYTLAEKYGINQSQVSRIISGERRANQDKGVKK